MRGNNTVEVLEYALTAAEPSLLICQHARGMSPPPPRHTRVVNLGPYVQPPCLPDYCMFLRWEPADAGCGGVRVTNLGACKAHIAGTWIREQEDGSWALAKPLQPATLVVKQGEPLMTLQVPNALISINTTLYTRVTFCP